jgi:nicotinate-nucleotide adenylyltransferase
MNARRRVGILGGTFDPPHTGHRSLALSVRESLALDEVLLVVANDPWQKSATNHVSPAADRMAMTTMAVAGLEGVSASSLEIDRGGPSYSVETLETLRAQEPETEFFLIVGADAACGLSTWKRSEELPALATLVIVDRPGTPVVDDPIGWQVIHVLGPGIDIASRDLRQQVDLGIMNSEALLPEVRDYISDHGLYAVHRV